ncbi:hotdog fold domain-containing protein [Desulfosediminicola flagellatus]|uniref:hotdog fold domain-containing protein n=1 Tax=Desulfosediminicola flagellatus TaxID=2569541 RepID=UPI0010ACE726|nr:hotdog fold domain-containing protein [Desulfosediminicola flagellatus]
MSKLYELYQAVGNDAFSKEISKIAPYFSTIDPMFVDLKPGYAEITMPNSPKVHNHLGTVHAIAMCNAAEMVAGLMTEVSIPKNYRWIPIGMNVKYLAKATTDLRAITVGSDINWKSPGEKTVPVKITDTHGVEVCFAEITVLISEKQS